MKILYVLEHYSPHKGGVERLFQSIAENLQKENHQVTVITTQLQSAHSSDELLNGVRVIRLPLRNRFLFTFFSIPFVIYYALKHDIIHTTSYNAAFPAFIASFFCRKKCIITFHEVWDNLWWNIPYYNIGRKTLFYVFEKIILALPFDQYIAVSDATKNALIKAGVDSRKITRIYNGINYDSFVSYKHESPQTPTICYYGRLGVSKGLNDLLEALKHINSRYKLLLIIPKHPTFIYKQIIKKIEQNQLSDKTMMKHDLSDVELFNTISKTSFVVIPSWSEGFCFNAVECAAMHIPVVASANTALLETVSGYHMYIENNDLNSAIEKALQNNWQQSETKHFRLVETVAAYKNVYEKIYYSIKN
ncbi:MAG: glycosyltransferase family 4 protein [Bacteroidota bacterium]